MRTATGAPTSTSTSTTTDVTAAPEGTTRDAHPGADAIRRALRARPSPVLLGVLCALLGYTLSTFVPLFGAPETLYGAVVALAPAPDTRPGPPPPAPAWEQRTLEALEQLQDRVVAPAEPAPSALPAGSAVVLFDTEPGLVVIRASEGTELGQRVRGWVTNGTFSTTRDLTGGLRSAAIFSLAGTFAALIARAHRPQPAAPTLVRR